MDERGSEGEAGCGCMHVAGAVLTGIAIIGLIAGSVIIIVFEEGVTGYWVGVVCLAIGVTCSLLVLVYICLTFRKQQDLFGCVHVTSKAPNNPPAPSMPPGPKATVPHHHPKASPTPRPSTGGGLPSLGHFERKQPNSAYTDSTRGVEWDPDTVLGDD